MICLKLSIRYMRHNLKRTLFSLVAISLSYILCFCVLDAFYSFWDYEYEQYLRIMPYELYYIMNGENEESDAQTISRIQALAKDEAVEKLRIYLVGEGDNKLVLESQLKTGKRYYLQLKLRDNSSLKASAEALSNKYGFSFQILSGMEHYLRQDESASTALLNFLIYLAATVLGFFGGAVIRNMMMMSVTERNRDYGLLRCVGMSGLQLLVMLLIEGLLLGGIASLIGMSLGYDILLLLKPLLVRSLALADYFRFAFYPRAALYAYLLCVVLTIFSLVEPFRLSSQVSPLEALHGKLAKELTVGEAIKRITKRFAKRRKSKDISLWEKLFEAPGFLAQRNRYRRRGGGGALFFSVLFASMLLSSVLCVSGSMRATVREEFENIKLRYREVLAIDFSGSNPPTEDARYEKIRGEMEKRADVTDTVIAMHGFNRYDGVSLLAYDEAGAESWLFEMGFFAEDMKKEEPYLKEGEVDHERMLAEGGVLLYDMSGNGRYASYKVGDQIELLSPEGAYEAYRVFCKALDKLADESAIPAFGEFVLTADDTFGGRVTAPKEKATPLISLMRSEVGAERFAMLCSMMSRILKDMGYDCSAYESEDSYRLADYLDWLKKLYFARGYTESLRIFGLLYEEQYSSGIYIAEDKYTEHSLCLVYPMELLQARYSRMQKLKSELEEEYRDEWRKGAYAELAMDKNYRYELGINRKGKILDASIRGYALQYGLYYLSPFELANTGGDYFEDLGYLNALRVIAILIGGFILLICLFNILNTLLADIEIRKRELWLCRVVGIDDKQLLRMLLIEHGFSLTAALMLGAVLSFVLSRLAFKLDIGGYYKFVWPWWDALMLLLAMAGILYLACAREIKREDLIGRG